MCSHGPKHAYNGRLTCCGLMLDWCWQVWLCKEQKTGKTVALKKLKKAEMLRRGQVDHVKAERNVLAEVDNPFIVRLYYSFQVRSPGCSHCTKFNVIFVFLQMFSKL